MKASASDRGARRRKKLTSEEIRRGREESEKNGESDGVSPVLICPCFKNSMGEWEGIAFYAPGYTTKKKKDFWFLYTPMRWGTGTKSVPTQREW